MEKGHTHKVWLIRLCIKKWNSGKVCPVIRCHSNDGPFDNHFYNLNIEHICYLHSWCSFNFSNKFWNPFWILINVMKFVNVWMWKFERWLKENPICFTNLKENKIWDCVYVEGGGLYPLFTPSRYEISILSKSSETSWELF